MADLTATQLYGLGTTSSNWTNVLSRTLREQAQVARSLSGAGRQAQAHAARLDSIAHELRGVGIDDPLHLLALAVFQLRRIASPTDRDSYVPSESAQLVINKVGTTEAFIPWEQFLTALFSGEIRDLSKSFSGAATQREAAKRSAEEADRKLDRANTDRERLSVALAAAEGALAETRNRLAAAERKVTFLSGQLAANGQPVSAAPNAPAPQDDYPSSEQLEQVFNQRRVNIAPGLIIERHKGSTWYQATIVHDRHWLGPAIGPDRISISQALEARARLVDAAKETKQS